MARIQFISTPRDTPGRSVAAILISCAFHGVVLGGLLAVAILYQLFPPRPSGSAPGATVITMELMQITDSPPVPTPKQTPDVDLPVPESETQQPRLAMSPTKLPDVGIPVLAMKTHESQAEKKTMRHAPTPNNVKPAAAKAVSSYTPGPINLLHPPYPPEAQARGLTGTVVMSVRFDSAGNVAQVEISKSSGVGILDSSTKIFVQKHWHYPELAGQTKIQPIQYLLVNH